jgi:DNA-binding response OmpR family regulator
MNQSYSIYLDDQRIREQIAEALGPTSLTDQHKPTALFVGVDADTIAKLREAWPYVPILVIAADADDQLIGDALAAGANDFITKPVSREELLARLIARMKETAVLAARESLRIGPLRYQKAQRTLQLGDQTRHLTPGEAQLLECLAQSGGMTVARGELKRRIWGELKVSENALDKKVHDLRSALRSLTDRVSLSSVYGKGFHLTVREDDQGLEPARTQKTA